MDQPDSAHSHDDPAQRATSSSRFRPPVLTWVRSERWDEIFAASCTSYETVLSGATRLICGVGSSQQIRRVTAFTEPKRRSWIGIRFLGKVLFQGSGKGALIKAGGKPSL